MLKQAYADDLKEANVEVVFVSSDQNADRRQSSKPGWGSTSARWRGFLSRRGRYPRWPTPSWCSQGHRCRACPDDPA